MSRKHYLLAALLLGTWFGDSHAQTGVVSQCAAPVPASGIDYYTTSSGAGLHSVTLTVAVKSAQLRTLDATTISNNSINLLTQGSPGSPTDGCGSVTLSQVPAGTYQVSLAFRFNLQPVPVTNRTIVVPGGTPPTGQPPPTDPPTRSHRPRRRPRSPRKCSSRRSRSVRSRSRSPSRWTARHRSRSRSGCRRAASPCSPRWRSRTRAAPATGCQALAGISRACRRSRHAGERPRSTAPMAAVSPIGSASTELACSSSTIRFHRRCGAPRTTTWLAPRCNSPAGNSALGRPWARSRPRPRKASTGSCSARRARPSSSAPRSSPIGESWAIGSRRARNPRSRTTPNPSSSIRRMELSRGTPHASVRPHPPPRRRA